MGEDQSSLRDEVLVSIGPGAEAPGYFRARLTALWFLMSSAKSGKERSFTVTA
jgi:hypothetical protein